MRLPLSAVIMKILRPELRTAENYENPNLLRSLAGFATLNIKTKPVNMTAMGSYVQNATDLVMLGGYGVTGITDPTTGIRSFANLNTASGWVDISTNGKFLQTGLFAGYSKNLGSSSELTGPVFARGANISALWRAAIRMLATREKLTLALEIETSAASYGQPDSFGKVQNSKPVTNHRILFAAIYKF
jgi:hypothetical protein